MKRRIVAILDDYITSTTKIELIKEILSDDLVQDEGQMHGCSLSRTTADIKAEVETLSTDLQKPEI